MKWLKLVELDADINFLTNRVVEDWNSLTQEAIDSTNKNLFKNRIDKILNFT